MPLGVFGESPLAPCLEPVDALAFAFALAPGTTAGGTTVVPCTEAPDALPLDLCCGTVAIGPTSAADPAAKLVPPFVVVLDPKPARRLAEPAIAKRAATRLTSSLELDDEVLGEVVVLDLLPLLLEAMEKVSGTAVAIADALDFASDADLSAADRAAFAASDVVWLFLPIVRLTPRGGSSRMGSYEPDCGCDAFAFAFAGANCTGEAAMGGAVAVDDDAIPHQAAPAAFGGTGACPLSLPVMTPGL